MWGHLFLARNGYLLRMHNSPPCIVIGTDQLADQFREMISDGLSVPFLFDSANNQQELRWWPFRLHVQPARLRFASRAKALMHPNERNLCLSTVVQLIVTPSISA
jgi:hypothetical protein